MEELSTAGRLEQIKKAARQGQKDQAYNLSRELTELAPDCIEAWLYCAVLTPDQNKSFEYLNHAVTLAPEHTRAQRGMYELMKYYMQHDPFLRYMEESGPMYRVLTGEGEAINVPKDREAVISHLSSQETPLKPIYRWLRYAILGLPLAGIPTLISASVAWGLACRAIYRTLGTNNLRRAEAALIYASVLWVVGFLFSLLLVLHL